MRKSLLAIAFAALASTSFATGASAYEFVMTYHYQGSVFAMDANLGFESAPVEISGTITTSSPFADPQYIGFYDKNIRVFFNAGSFLASAQFDALGGDGYVTLYPQETTLLDNHDIGGSVYGSDRSGNALMGSISGAFQVAAVTTVPLPASASLFGAAVAALGLAGFGMKRRMAAA